MLWHFLVGVIIFSVTFHWLVYVSVRVMKKAHNFFSTILIPFFFPNPREKYVFFFSEHRMKEQIIMLDS